MHTVKVENPHAFNLIMGRFPFIKTIDEIYQALVKALPGIRFGLACKDNSKPETIRLAGTDDSLMSLAKKNALNIGAGDTFILFLEDPGTVTVMNALKDVKDISAIYCATNHNVEVIVSDGKQGRGIMGLLGGYASQDDRRILFKKNPDPIV